MPINEYDNAINSLQKEGKLPTSGIDPVSQIADDLRQEKFGTIEGSFNLAKDKDSKKQAEVFNLSNELGIHPNAAERNFDNLKRETSYAKIDFEDVVNRAPALARWLESPENFAISKQDVSEDKKSPLVNAEMTLRKLDKDLEDRGFLRDLYDSTRNGYYQLNSSKNLLQAAFGSKDKREAAKELAELVRKRDEIHTRRSQYMLDFYKKLELSDYNKKQSAMDWYDSVEALQNDEYLKFAKEWTSGATKTAWHFLGRLSVYADNKQATANFLAETMTASSPSLILGTAIAVPLSLLGTAVAGPPGGLFLGRVGYVLGGAAGELPVEMGAIMFEDLIERGVITEEQWFEVLNDEELMGDLKKKSLKGGAAITVSDAVWNAFLGGKVSKAKGLKQIAKSGLREGFEQTVGGVSSETIKQAVIGEIDPSSILDELVGEGLFAGAEVSSVLLRNSLSKIPTKAMNDLIITAKDAQDAFNDALNIKRTSDSIAETELLTLSKQKSGEIINEIVGDKDTIQFQYDEFNNYWIEQGESPVEKFEELGGDPKYYNNMKDLDALIDINKASFLTQYSGTEHVQGLLPFLRNPDGRLSLLESKIVYDQLPKTMDDLAKGILTQKEMETKTQEQILKGDLQKKLVATGKYNKSQASQLSLLATKGFSSAVQRYPELLPKIEKLFNIRILGPESVDFANNQVLSQEAVLDEELRTLTERVSGFNSEIESLNQSLEVSQESGNIEEQTNIKNRIKDVERNRNIAENDIKELEIKQRSLIEEKPPTILLQDETSILPKGFFDSAENIIAILDGADLSTFFHELGHFYFNVLEKLRSDPNAPASLLSDWKIIIDWFLNQNHEAMIKQIEKSTKSTDSFISDNAKKAISLIKKNGGIPFVETTIRQWGTNIKDKAVRSEILRPYLELWARGFESFIFEGKAPSNDLRGAFVKFKVWLTTVYRDIKNLNVNLTADVRNVMERLLATEEEIQAIRGKYPTFLLNSKELNLDNVTIRSMAELIEKTENKARELLNQEMLALEDKERKGFLDQKREQIRFEVEAKYVKHPSWIAYNALKNGQNPDGSPLLETLAELKIDRKSVVNGLGKDIANQLPKGISSTKTGTDYNILAGMLGFKTGAELVENLILSKDIKQKIEFEVETRIATIEKDLLANPNRSDVAVEHYHNEHRSRLIKKQLSLLMESKSPEIKQSIKRISARIPSNFQIKNSVQRILNDIPIKQIRPRTFELAERKNAKLAGEALARLDIAEAFDRKIKEMFSNESYKEAIKFRNDLEKFNALTKKFNESDKSLSKKRDISFVKAGRALLSRFGIGSEQSDPMKHLEFLKKYEEDTYNTMKTLVNSLSSDSKEFNLLTFGEFQELNDTVNAIWDLSRSSNLIEIRGEKKEINDIVEEFGKIHERFARKGSKDGINRSKRKRGEATQVLDSTKAFLRMIEPWAMSLDLNDINGLHNEIFVKKIFTPALDYRAEVEDLGRKINDIIEGANLNTEEILAHELYSDGSPRGFAFKGTVELLGALLHTGNPSNKQKLIRGNGWGDIDINGNLDVSRWNRFIERMQKDGVLRKEHYDAAQAIWNILEELKPRLQIAHKQRYKFYFPEIVAEPFETPWGVYKGGYVPAKPDSFRVTNQRILEEIDVLEKNGTFNFPTTGNGATRQRNEQFAAPLQMDIGFLSSHIDWALRFIHLQNPVSEVARIVFNKKFRESVDRFDTAAVDQMIVPWLQRTAQQRVTMPTGQGSFLRIVDRGANYLRQTSAANLMMGNIVNTVEQLFSVFIAFSKVRKGRMLSKMWQYIRMRNELMEKYATDSKVMKERYNSQMFIIQERTNDLLLNPSKFKRGKRWINQHVYILQHIFQNVTDTIIYGAAYDEAIADLDMDHPDAVFRAEQMVRTTQGSAAPEASARLLTGSPLVRLVAMFLNFWVTQANFLGTQFSTINNTVGLRKGMGQLFNLYMWAFMVPAVLSGLLRKTIGGSFDEDQDDVYIDDVMDVFFGSQVRYGSAMLPFVGQAATLVMNRFNNKWYDDKISISPAISMIESSLGGLDILIAAGTDKEVNFGDIKDATTGIGIGLGVPLLPVTKPFKYINDVRTGRTDPTGPIDYTRGLITGKGPRRRK